MTDARGRTATASADVKVTNAAPAITDARVDDAAPASFSARITDAGALDTQTAKVFWNGSADGVTVPLVATGDGYVVMAHAPGHATSAKLVVSDGDGGSAEALASRIVLPVNAAPTADDASAKVLAGADVSLDLPARDPEAEALTYEIVDQPAHGTVSLRAPALDPAAADVTYNADEYIGTRHVHLPRLRQRGRVAGRDGHGRRAAAAGRARADHRARRGADRRAGGRGAARLALRRQADRPKIVEAASNTPAEAAAGLTLPSTKTCVSRRKFSIRIKKGAYTPGRRVGQRQAGEGAEGHAHHRDRRSPRAAQGPFQGQDRRDPEDRQGRQLHPSIPNLHQEGGPVMKRLMVIAAFAVALVSSAPAGACAASADDPCFHDPMVATVTGEMWWDYNANGVRDADEHPGYLNPGEVWADYNRDGARQEGETLVDTERDGTYRLPVDTRKLAAGVHQVDVRFRFTRYPNVEDKFAPSCVAPAPGCLRTVDVTAEQTTPDVTFPAVGVAQLNGMV